MKQPTRYSILLIILSLSCNAGTKNNQKSGISDRVNSGNSITTYFWTGQINSKTPLFMWVAVKDSIVQGELVYTNIKGNIPLKLLGRVDKKGAISACEYQADGNIRGTFVIDQPGASATGRWESTGSHKDYTFELNTKDTSLQRIDTSFQPKIIPGIYTYMYGKTGRQARISLREDQDDKGLFDIESFTFEPTKRSTMADKRSVRVKGNQGIYTITSTSTCSFQIRFYNNFLIVDYVKDFEDSASHCKMYPVVEGVYYKTSL
jgi:hypothetical protein